MTTETIDPGEDAKPARSRVLGIALRVGVTCATLGVWWWLADLPLADLGSALTRIPISAFVIALAVSLGNLVVGAVRWRTLLAAYGAERLPPLSLLIRLYYIGIFFNTFAPANVGGDVVRAHVTRRAFPGQAGAYLIVVIERVFGLAGLMLVASTTLLVAPIEELAGYRWLGAVGTVAAVGAVAAPALAKRMAGVLPGKLGELAASLPTVRVPALLAVVLALSVVTQSLVAVTGHVFVHALADTSLAESMVLVPIALASMYLPTIAGLGAREASFVALFTLVSVSEADATAASLAVMMTQLLTAGIGGLVLVVFGTPKLDATADEASTAPSELA